MVETAALALATFFATIGPLDVAAMFAALTAHLTPEQRRLTAWRAVLVATIILLAFALAGELVLASLGISLAALRTSGGILLLLIGIDMAFARSSGGTSTTDAEQREANTRADISIFPLAMPLIAGPGAMGAAILLMADQQGDASGQAIVLASLLAILLSTFVAFLLASKIQQLLGLTGMHVVTRVMGVLLAALAVQFIFDGIAESGLI